MPSCKEVARAIASDPRERRRGLPGLGVRLHLLMCRHCRAYGRQIRALGALARRLCQESAPADVHLRRLETALLREIESRHPPRRT